MSRNFHKDDLIIHKLTRDQLPIFSTSLYIEPYYNYQDGQHKSFEEDGFTTSHAVDFSLASLPSQIFEFLTE